MEMAGTGEGLSIFEKHLLGMTLVIVIDQLNLIDGRILLLHVTSLKLSGDAV